jgi:hypothetical protein
VLADRLRQASNPYGYRFSAGRYVQRPIYVPLRLVAVFLGLAKSDGFRLGDLGRGFIVLGLTYRLLMRGNFAKRARAHAIYQELQRLTRRPVKRAYAMERGARGVWVNVWLHVDCWTSWAAKQRRWVKAATTCSLNSLRPVYYSTPSADVSRW